LSDKWNAEFKHKSEEQAGVQLLQLFIEDLLGRDTDAAKIFKVKVREDYATLPVVSMCQKSLAACALVGINVFFLYFALLRGQQQGIQWQRAYLISCIVQITMEIGFSETLQCLYINYLVPRLLSRTDIEKVRNILQACIIQLCHAHSEGSPISPDWSEDHTVKHVKPLYFVDTSNYLFVSKRVARAYPSMMESMMIASYHSMFPGKVGKKWHSQAIGQTTHIDEKRYILWFDVRKGVTALTMFLTLSIVQFMTSAPVRLQKLTVRFCEPFLIGIAALTWSYVVQSWTAIAIFSTVCFFGCVGLLYRFVRDARQESTRMEAIQVDLEQNLEMHIKPVTTVEKEPIKPVSNDESDSLWSIILSSENDSVGSSSLDSEEFELQYGTDNSDILHLSFTAEPVCEDSSSGISSEFIPSLAEFDGLRSDSESWKSST
jgi:hypothetical protein